VPRAYAHYFPATRVDAVDIDGALFRLGERFFGLRPGPRLRLIAQDARPFLRRTTVRYDAIFVDAYRQPYIPFYLATREFFRLVRSRLTPGGVVVVNVGHVEGSTKLERVLGATMAAELPHVWRDPAVPTNTQLVASAAPIEPERAAAAAPRALRALGAEVAARLEPRLPGGEVYTDDRAPVEWLIDRSIVAFARGRG
jgi:spermidine synthase